jgi:hypothetical protein
MFKQRRVLSVILALATLCLVLGGQALALTFTPSLYFYARPGQVGTQWTVPTTFNWGSEQIPNVTKIDLYSVAPPRGVIEYSTNGGSSWSNLYDANGNTWTYPGNLLRYRDTAPGDTTSSSFNQTWMGIQANDVHIGHYAGIYMYPDNPPTDISSDKSDFFNDVSAGTTVATLTPADTGMTTGGYWAIDSQSVPNLFTLTFNTAVGNTATLKIGSGALPAAGQSATVTVRYYDNFQTDSAGNPVGGQGFAKTLTFTSRSATSQDLNFGNDLKISTYAPNGQIAPALATLSNGNTVTVWQSAGQGGEGSTKNGIYGQITDPQGVAVGSEFAITAAGNGIDETAPAVAALNNGRFVVSYATEGASGGDGLDVAYRIVEANGTVGGELVANTTLAGDQTSPDVATLSDGTFLITWVAATGDIHGQRFNAATGSKSGGQLVINHTLTNGGTDDWFANPGIAPLDNGGYAITWGSGYTGNIYAAVNGGASDIEVDTNAASWGTGYPRPRVARLAGSFVVTWDSYLNDLVNYTQTDIFARHYDNAGTPLGTAIQINTTAPAANLLPSIATLSGGGYLVAWQSNLGDYDQNGIFGRRFTSGGQAVDSADFEINQYRKGDQNSPAVTGLASDLFASVWTDNTSDLTSAGIEGRVLLPAVQASPPAVTSVSPTNGLAAGGTSVVITGSNLTGASAVKFGSTSAASFTVNSATQISATAPAGAAGTVDITVTTAGGTSATGASDRFTYLAATTTVLGSSVNPSSVGQSVTYSATVNGSATGSVNFKDGASSITGCAASALAAGVATCTTSALALGSHSITAAYSGDGSYASSTSSVLTQVVNVPPTVTGVSPASAPAAGGASVTVTGTSFTGATAVKFGSTDAASFTVNSATQISATAPAGSVGTVDITVVTPAGTSPTGAADQFSFYTVPGAPTVGSATAGVGQASVTFSAPASNGGGSITGYTVTASPGGATATGASSPITVSGLNNGTTYTFTVTATNGAGTGAPSGGSNGVTPKANQTISFANPGAQTFGSSPTLTATADSFLTPSFTSSTTGVCTVTSGGVLTFVTVGTCTIDADQAGSLSFNAAPTVSRSFTVGKGSQTLVFSQPAAVSYGHAPLDLSGSATAGASSSPVTFSIVGGGTGSGTISGTDNKTLTITGAGTIILQADQAADTNYNAAAPVQRTLTVNKAALSITASAQTKSYGASDPALTYSNSGLTNGDSASVITGSLSRAPGETVAGGPYPIGQGTLAAGNNYTVSFTGANLTVTKADPVISWPTPFPVPAGTVLDIRELNASANVAGSFVYSPAAGTALGAGGGQFLMVTFTPTDGANYAQAVASVAIDVQKSPQTITFAQPAAKLMTDAPFNLSASSDSGLTVSFASSNPAVAVVSGSTVTITGAGVTTITASQAGNASYGAAASVNQPLVVGYSATAPVLVVSTLSDGSRTGNATLNVSGSVTGVNGIKSLLLNGTPVTLGGGNTFSQAVALSEGNNTITVTVIDNAGLEATNSRSIILDTTAPVLTVTAPADNSTVASGTVTLAGSLDAAGTVQVTVNGGAVQAATMSGNGFSLVLNLIPGTNTIQVTATDLVGNSSSASRTVVSDTANPSLAITSPAQDMSTDLASMTIDGTVADSLTPVTITVTVDGLTFTPAVNSGTYQQLINLPLAKQYAIKVTATDQAGNHVSVQRNVIRRGAPAITWANPAAIVYGAALSATQLNASASVAGTFTYSPASGTVLSAGSAQTLNVTFTPTDLNSYAPATASVLIDVNRAASVITWANPAAISYGALISATQLNATANVPGSFVYTPASGAQLSAGPGQTLTVSFTPTNSANYAPVSKTVLITVNQATPTVTWNNPAAIVHGTALGATQLNATASVPGSFVYTPPAGTVMNGGPAQTLSVVFVPTDGADYATVTKNVTIDVTKAAPVLAWNNPAAITYGTLLGATQLNATADVAGSFSYSPAAGTQLTAGTQSLTVTFTPSDTVKFNAASKTVSLVVNKATPVLAWGTPAPVSFGTALGATQLNATSNVAGSLVYTPAAGAQLPSGAGQTLSVAFTPTDGANYTAASASVLFDVGRAAQSISFNALAVKLLGDASFDLSATSTSGLSVSFASSNPAVATVSGNTVTVVGEGTCTITASQAGNGSYAPASAVNQPLVVRYNGVVPTLSLSTLIDGSITHVPTLNITGSAASQNGIQAVLINGEPVTLGVSNGFSQAYTLKEGRNSFITSALDRAGLETTDSRSIILDTAAPAITVTSPADNSTLSATSVTVTGHLDNPGTVSATVNDGSAQQASMDGNEFSVTVNLANGSNTIQLTGVDLAGNSSTVKRTVLSDTASPSLAISYPAADLTLNANSFVLTGTVSDDLGGTTVTISMDGQQYTPVVTNGTFQQLLGLPSAKVYPITVTAVDQGGNSATVLRNVIRPRILGDLNHDGKVDIVDALIALQMAVGSTTASDEDLVVGDVAPLVGGVPQPDGVIDIEDAFAILKKAVGSLNF